jgi:hypothetical protein
LRARPRPWRLLIVEADAERCRALEGRGVEAVCADGTLYLTRQLRGAETPHWIVAAAPIHLAFQWLRAELSRAMRVDSWPIPDQVLDRLPNPIRIAADEAAASNADFLCPPHCSEAGRCCTATGRPRPRRMYAFLERMPLEGVKIMVVRSRQLAPGVGGYRPGDLFAAAEAARKERLPQLLATACKCHAVISGFKLIQNG